MQRFMISLDESTFQGLYAWALEERRTPNGQAAWVLTQTIKARVKQQAALQHLEGAALAPADTDAEAEG